MYFSEALIEDYGEQLDEDARGYLERIRAASQRMGLLIEDLLKLSRVTQHKIKPEATDVSDLCRNIIADLQAADPDRTVEVAIEDGLVADADPHLADIAIRNLLQNAWKYSSKREAAKISVCREDKFGPNVISANLPGWVRGASQPALETQWLRPDRAFPASEILT